MAVYDPEKAQEFDPNRLRPAESEEADQLRDATGIGPDEEAGMENRAKAGSDYDSNKGPADNNGWFRPDPATRNEAARIKEIGDGAKGAGDGNGASSGASTATGGGEVGPKSKLGKARAVFGAGKGKKGIFKRKKQVLALGGVGIFWVGVFIVFMLFFSSLKAVHFATVLRSIGFARFNMYMRETYSKTIFDAAVLTDASTGNFSLEERSLYQKLRGINPEKQLSALGTEDKLKFEFESEKKWGGLKTESNFKGVEIDGNKVNLDEISTKNFGKSFNDLSVRERLTVKADFVNTVRDGLAERLALEGRSFRSGVYDGLRQATGIRMSKWLNKAREFAGKTRTESLKLEAETTTSVVEGGGELPKSGINAEQEAADKIKAANEEAFVNGASEAERAASDITKKTARQTAADLAGGAKEASTFILLTTVACIIHDLDASLNHTGPAREKQAARYGHDLQTEADQIKSGDVTPEAAGAAAYRYDGAEQAVAYKTATGQGVSETDQPQYGNIATITPPAQTFGKIIGIINTVIESGLGGPGLDKIPGIGGFLKAGQTKVIDVGCNVVLNPYVQGGLAIGEIALTVFTAGQGELTLQAVKAGVEASLYAGASVGVGELIGSLLEKAIGSYAGSDFSSTSTGTKLYNDAAVATDYLQQTGTRQINFGGPMSPKEANESQTVAMEQLRESYQSKPFGERYFAIDNPFSLVGKMASIAPSSVSSLLSDAKSWPLQLVDSIGSAFRNLASVFSTAMLGDHNFAFAAANNVNSLSENAYGVDEWGWTNAEMARISSDTAFTYENLDAFIVPQLDALNNKYLPCYTYVLQVERPEKCKDAAFFRTDEALKWRAWQAQSYAANQLAEDAPLIPTQSATTATNGTNQNVFMLGDSLTAGMENLNGTNPANNYIETTFANDPAKLQATVNAGGCRGVYQTTGPINTPACSATTVVDGITVMKDPATVKTLQTYGQKGSVVVALGTNATETAGGNPSNDLFKQKAVELINAIRDANANLDIYWINLAIPSNTAQQNARNAILQQLEGEQRITVLDWATYVQTVNNDTNTTNDIKFDAAGVHNDADSYKAKVDFLLRSLTGLR